ncbi:MAG: menaquinone biosynthesis protein [Phycisphaerales bacterium]|nr:menaquinone biosynthesis protein [Phycisphaerales bacterium]
MTTLIRDQSAQDEGAPSCAAEVLRVGLVPYLNAWPVCWGLQQLSNWRTSPTVPSALAGQFEAGEIDLSLGSSIDAMRLDPQPVVLPVSPIASEGSTLTVRIVSQVDPVDIQALHCDTDSHTSVALARILLQDEWGASPEIVPFDARSHVGDWPNSVLLIGDKVITDASSEAHWPVQIDLGEVWTRTTGLPFVYALWMLRPEQVHRADSICAVLDRQRRANALRFDAMVARGADAHGWPVALAREYLSRHLSYRFDERHAQGLDLFVERCRAHGLVDAGRMLQVHDWQG